LSVNFFFLVVVLGFKLRTLSLMGRCFTTWATRPALFDLVTLETGSCFLPRLAWISILLCYTSHHSQDDRHITPCPVFSVKMGSCELLCLGRPWITILPISTAQEARSWWLQPVLYFKIKYNWTSIF
jgi:hypothetical protein